MDAPLTATLCVPAEWLDDDPSDAWAFKGLEVSGTARQVLGHMFLELGHVSEVRLPVQTESAVSSLALRHDSDDASLTLVSIEGDVVREQLRIPVATAFPAAAWPVGNRF